jgi:endonuclease/exonuclease/phosphatase family metal-dependent hydrolase
VRAKLYRLLYRVHLLLALFTLLAFAAPAINPGSFWPAAFLGIGIPWLLALHFLFGLGWIVLRRYYVWVSLLCIVTGWGHVTRIVNLSGPEEALPEQTALSVMTFNIHGLRDVADNSNVKLETLTQLVAARDCDLLCLQEFPQSANRLENLAALLRARTRLQYRYSDRNGNFALFSAFPITDAETQYFPNRANGYQRADLRIGERTVRVFNVHLQTNAVTGIAERVASEGNFKEKQTWLDIRGMMGRFKRSARQRALQAEEIAGLVAQSPHPVLLCGDFNDTPHSYTYRALARPMQDAFQAKGRGFGITYTGRIPALRIDYLLAGKEFQVLEYQIEKKGFSDHRAVWGRVGL